MIAAKHGFELRKKIGAWPDIPQIAVGFSLILLPFRSPDKAEPGRLEAEPSDFEPPPRPLLKKLAR
jgi:hypothetical protein